MLTVHLVRALSGIDGTFGNLVLPTGTQLITGELPWHNNKPRISCIPLGTYDVVWGYGSRLGYGYKIPNVPGRSGIAIHVANFCADKSSGLKSEIEGCICLGMSLGTNGKQRMVMQSRIGITKFLTEMKKQPFLLEISDAGQTYPAKSTLCG